MIVYHVKKCVAYTRIPIESVGLHGPWQEWTSLFESIDKHMHACIHMDPGKKYKNAYKHNDCRIS